MGHTIVNYTAKPEREQENAALVRAVFEELAEARPAEFRYDSLEAVPCGSVTRAGRRTRIRTSAEVNCRRRFRPPSRTSCSDRHGTSAANVTG
jgi:hypothetical protein